MCISHIFIHVAKIMNHEFQCCVLQAMKYMKKKLKFRFKNTIKMLDIVVMLEILLNHISIYRLQNFQNKIYLVLKTS